MQRLETGRVDVGVGRFLPLVGVATVRQLAIARERLKWRGSEREVAFRLFSQDGSEVGVPEELFSEGG